MIYCCIEELISSTTTPTILCLFGFSNEMKTKDEEIIILI